MVKMDIEDPLRVAEWLKPAISQRERAIKEFKERFGPDSAGTIDLMNEVARIKAFQTGLLQARADAPMSPKPR